jgi:(p)ppGpp synthase/HD superfamily hydrolase
MHDDVEICPTAKHDGLTGMTMKEDDKDRDAVLIGRARAFALVAHAAMNQRRKYTGEPYAAHLAEVAELVARVLFRWH